MSSPFDQSIFGPLIQLKSSHQTENKLKNPQPIPNITIGIDHDSTKSSSNTQIYKNRSSKKFPFGSCSTARTDNSFTHYYTRQSNAKTGSSSNIENDSIVDAITNILKQVNLKRVTGEDNFYCSCGEHEEIGNDGRKQLCVACGGKGEVDGNNNMVKFIEYIIEFKLGLKGSYASNQDKGKLIQERREEQYIKQNTSIFCNKSKGKNIGIANTNSSSLNYSMNRSKQINITKKTIQTNQSTEITNSSSFLGVGGITLGMNSMTESNHFVAMNQRDVQEGEQQQGDQKQNDLRVFGEEEMERRDHYQRTSYGFNEKGKKLRFGCVTGSMDHNSYGDEVGTRSMLYDMGRPKITDTRKSLPAEPRMSLSEFKQKLCKKNNVHSRYSCDNCKITPIEGIRYHCPSLMCNNDYDLCEKCYKKLGHKHKMVEIKSSPINQICKNLQQFSNKSVCSSIRLSMGVKNNSRLYDYDDMSKIDEEYDQDYYKPIFKSSIH